MKEQFIQGKQFEVWYKQRLKDLPKNMLLRDKLIVAFFCGWDACKQTQSKIINGEEI